MESYREDEMENVCEALQTEIEFLQMVCPFNLTFIMFDHFSWENCVILHIEHFCINNMTSRQVELLCASDKKAEVPRKNSNS